MLLHSGCYGENIKVEDDILGRKIKLLREDPVGTLCNFNPSFKIICLPNFIKSHHHNCGTITLYLFRMA